MGGFESHLSCLSEACLQIHLHREKCVVHLIAYRINKVLYASSKIIGWCVIVATCGYKKRRGYCDVFAILEWVIRMVEVLSSSWKFGNS